MARVKIGNVWDIEGLSKHFAPAGFGLGKVSGHDCLDCNAAVLNGTYYLFGESAANHPGNNMQYGCMEVKRRGNYITQIVHYDCREAKRFSKDGGVTWGEWEWVNPPMDLGVEYRTTERWHGKTVYTKLFDFGESANGAYIEHQLNPNPIIRYSAVAGAIPLPHFNTAKPEFQITISVGATNITMECGESRTGLQTYVQVWYIKN